MNFCNVCVWFFVVVGCCYLADLTYVSLCNAQFSGPKGL